MRFCNCKRKDYEHVVQNGLSVTPQQMQEMTMKGIPVSTANLGLGYQDGVSSLDFNPPAEFVRGVDINDLWSLSKDVQKKFKKGYTQTKTE